MARGPDAEARRGYALIAPPFLYALVVLAAPLLTILAYSFLTDGYLTVLREATLDNYRQVWTDPIVRTVMLRSLVVSALVTLVTVLLAFPVAYYVSFVVRPEQKATWLFLITIPFWTSYLIRVFLWKVILGYNGVVNSTLTGLGIIDQPLTFILYNVNSIVITLAHAYAPFAILPIFVALEKIDRSLLEAGRDLGESRAMTFWRVTLPLAMPGVLAAVLIVFIPTIGDYVTPELIGGGKIPMIANLIQVQMLALDNRPLGSALAVTTMAIVAVVSVLFLALNRRFLRVREMTGRGRGLGAYAVLYLLFLYAPIILLPLFAFNSGTIIAFPLQGFTTQWFGQMWANATLRTALTNSLMIAVAASVLATALGIFAARASTRFAFPGKGGIMGFILLPMVLPEIIVAMSLLVVLLGAGVELSILTVILGHVLICVPYAIAVLSTAFSSLDRSLEEAAFDLGETRWSAFRLVTLPLVMPGIISSLLISFTISLDEFIIAFFLAGSEPTLPTYIFSQLRFPKQIPMIMALGTVLVALSIVLLALGEYFRRRGNARIGGTPTGGLV